MRTVLKTSNKSIWSCIKRQINVAHLCQKSSSTESKKSFRFALQVTTSLCSRKIVGTASLTLHKEFFSEFNTKTALFKVNYTHSTVFVQVYMGSLSSDLIFLQLLTHSLDLARIHIITFK